jgi:hypothetical protein
MKEIVCPKCAVVVEDAVPISEYGHPNSVWYNKETGKLEGEMSTSICVECGLQVKEIWELKPLKLHYFDVDSDAEWETDISDETE